ncbi:stellacyanin-like [Rutidosis leptorrhynchoides]|uniref:stellacyanin-like n=1 Tax=Rutidosis leptorrhynchoides TaxID=125765 RepID=UPI003A9A4286
MSINSHGIENLSQKMENKKFSIFLLVATILIVSTSANKTYIVGDEKVFKYPPGQNVMLADWAHYKGCMKNDLAEVLTTGNDEVTLGRAGEHYFTCTVDDNCQKGQKLFINVICPHVKPK